jgi:propanol-preferring alcohol dehydrogenase
MRAWIVENQRPMTERPMRYVELPPPEAEGTQVRIRVTACGICRTDAHIAEGDLPLHRRPTIPGHQVVGIIDQVGEQVTLHKVGDRAGTAWVGSACGVCNECRSERENYCAHFEGNGWHLAGGYAQYMAVEERFVYSLEGIGLDDVQAAPLMCPGVTAYATLRLAGVDRGDRVGLFGFGPTAFYALRLARALGADVLVGTRGIGRRELAVKEGASWVGSTERDTMPGNLDAAIIFPAAGALAETALAAVRPGGTVVSAAITMPGFAVRDYRANFWGRDFKTLYHVRRQDALGLLRQARTIDLAMPVRTVPPEQAQEALQQVAAGTRTDLATVIRW